MNRLLENPIFMTYLAYIVTFGNAVFILPLLLIKFDSVELSVWFLFSTIIGLAILADSGFGSTLVRVVSYFYSGAKKIPKNLDEFLNINREHNNGINREAISKTIQLSNIIYLTISIFASTIIFFIGKLILENVISKSNSSKELWIAFYVLIITVFIKMQTIKWNSFLQGFNQVAKQKQIETAVGLMKLIAYIIILLAGLKIFALVIIDLILSIIALILTKLKVNQKFQKIKIIDTKKFKFNRELFFSIYPSIWRYGGVRWGAYFINYGNSIIVSQLPDPKIIASFLVTQRIIYFASQIAQVPVYARLPQIFQMLAKHDFERLKVFVAKSIFSGISVLAFILIMVGSLGNLILDFMNIHNKLVSIDIFTIMAISIILEFHNTIHAQIYMGSNHIPFLFPTIISGILILAIGFSVVDVYGLMGIVLTQFLVQLSINNWYPVYLDLKLLNWRFKDYIFDLISVPKLYLQRTKK